MIVGGDSVWAVSLTGEERATLKADVETLNEETGLWLPSLLAANWIRARDSRLRSESLQADLNQQGQFVATAKESFDRQRQAHTDISKLATELETALRQAEPARQLAQIATRLAVIGLLIYRMRRFHPIDFALVC